MEAYVCIGTNTDGAHTWVTTFDTSESKRRPVITIWESLTGQRFKLGDPRVGKFYRSIGCIFNNQSFYANIQASDLVESTIFDIGDDSLWKSMDIPMIKSLPKVPIASLMPSNLEIIDEEKSLEKALKAKISGLRLSE